MFLYIQTEPPEPHQWGHYPIPVFVCRVTPHLLRQSETYKMMATIGVQGVQGIQGVQSAQGVQGIQGIRAVREVIGYEWCIVQSGIILNVYRSKKLARTAAIRAFPTATLVEN